MYDPRIVEPMRTEARGFGCTELLSAEDVHAALKQPTGTALVFVNSVCGCAAGGARPGLKLALQHATKPNNVYTVFAGQYKEATAAAREYFQPYQPSSPQIGLLKDGRLVHMLQRHDIEGRSPEMIAATLTAAFDTHCAK
ncbi:MAG: BrxA/BrxB family bacilliredoxin [Planctomycetes bacterium]|nr:BrxA/BrxB family bacilliredoxin [Planctomycetota bacterium]